jgi:hypothetical protein
MPEKFTPQPWVYRLVGRRSGVRLHVHVLHAEQLLGTFDRQRLDLVDVVLAFVIAFAGIALGVLVVEDRPCGFHDRIGSVVLRRNEPNELLLTLGLQGNEIVDLRIGGAQRRHLGHSHSSGGA